MTNTIGDNFTLSIIIGPSRRTEFYNAWSSLSEIDPQPKDILLFFNPFNWENHDVFIDMADIRACQLFKLKYFQAIARLWNLSIYLSNTPYIIISNDDVVFLKEDFLSQVYEKHNSGYFLVHASEAASCFSLSRSLIKKIGWFDERFPYSFEDVDFRIRMERAKIQSFRFEPNIVRHLRATSDRDQDKWDQSSLWFFEKWNIPQYIGLNRMPSHEERRKLQAQGLLSYINSLELKDTHTPSYYPMKDDIY